MVIPLRTSSIVRKYALVFFPLFVFGHFFVVVFTMNYHGRSVLVRVPVWRRPSNVKKLNDICRFLFTISSLNRGTYQTAAEGLRSGGTGP